MRPSGSGVVCRSATSECGFPLAKAAFNVPPNARHALRNRVSCWGVWPRPDGVCQRECTLTKAEIEIATSVINGRWGAAYANYEHEKIGEQQGHLAAGKVERLIVGLPTSFGDPRQQAVYEIAATLAAGRVVPLGLFRRARDLLGDAGLAADAGPRQALRAIALGLFDAIDAHPWVGTQLTREPWRPALLDLYESISGQLQALGVPPRALPDSAGVLVNYILGVAGQNAANARALAESKMDRPAFLAAVAAQWARLDPARYPSLHKAGTQLREHDDREQFLAGIDLILAGIETVNCAGKDSSARAAPS